MIRYLLTRVQYGLCAALLLGISLVAPAFGEVLATVDGQPITEEDLAEEARGQLLDLQSKLYEAKRAALEAAIAQHLLALEAKRLGVTVEQLVETKVTPEIQPVTPEDARRFFEANRARLRQPFDEVRGRIEDYLRQTRRKEAQDRYVAELKRQHRIEVRLAPPRAAVAAEGPGLGPRDAPVTLVEFSDFQCPFCRRAQATLTRLRQEYGARLRHVFRDFPIDSLHPSARAGHVAARCADRQGKFWEYHDRLFAEPEKMSPRDLIQHATVLGLDSEPFRACLETPEVKAAVERDVQAGHRAGVNSTPTFFVNGRALLGAQSYEAFRALIEEELERTKTVASPPNK